MSRGTIGLAVKNPDGPLMFGGGLQFEIPYGKDEYQIILSDGELDQLMDLKYAQLMGRAAVLSETFTIELEQPELPVIAWPTALNIEEVSGHTPHMSMEVAIATMSHVYEHRGRLLAARRTQALPDCQGHWEYVRYDEGPPLQDLEAAIEATAERISAGRQLVDIAAAKAQV